MAPILAVAEISERIARRRVPLVAVSPIVGGAAIKGPAAKMFRELGITPGAVAVAAQYRGVIDALVIDEQDRVAAAAIEAMGLAVCVTGTVMRDLDTKSQLAQTTLEFAARLRPANRTLPGLKNRFRKSA